MGNCLICHCQPKNQTIGPQVEGREMGVDASVLLEKMNYAPCKRYILVRRKLQIGEVYHLAPFLKQFVEPTTDNRKLKRRNVKIVVTTEQLKLLLNGSNMFQTKSRVASVSPKWLPSLPTIQEVQNY